MAAEQHRLGSAHRSLLQTFPVGVLSDALHQSHEIAVVYLQNGPERFCHHSELLLVICIVDSGGWRQCLYHHQSSFPQPTDGIHLVIRALRYRFGRSDRRVHYTSYRQLEPWKRKRPYFKWALSCRPLCLCSCSLAMPLSRRCCVCLTREIT